VQSGQTVPFQCDNHWTANKTGICPGWLKILKAVDSKQNHGQWWGTVNVINMHCYAEYAHMIKQRVLDYMIEFGNDLLTRDHDGTIKKDGKELWLTETACVFINDTDTSWEQKTSQFAHQLLWADTSWSESIPGSCTKPTNAYTGTLPGLRTTNKFSYQYKDEKTGNEKTRSGSWYELGFGAITWFTAQDPAYFDTTCTSYKPSKGEKPTFRSNIWTRGQLNSVWNALVGKTPH